MSAADPWTLNPAEPAAAAVRTQPDQVNNIEQVVVDAPPPGAYRVEVHGYSVPKGPQPFSLCAGPQLLRCSAQGRISLDRPAYACGALATIQVVDCDLNVDGGVVETVRVTLTSTAEPGGERVTLEETGTDTAIFRGVLPLETVDEVGVLLIADGDVLVATYIDADDGQGGLDVEVTETAGVDCNAPLVTGVQAAQVAPGRATITFETDEPTHATVWYGPSCGAPDDAVAGPGMRTYHRIELHGLSHDTVYYFAVAVEDSAGNATLDDNGGACYTFATPRVRDYFSEEFVADNDLDFRALLLTPDGSPAYYAACTVAIGLLPTDPAGGEVLPLADDDSAAITLAGGALVSLYGTSYDTIYVGSNGYLTFGAGDVDPSESFAEHFALPRVAALYDDLDPGARGTVSWHQTDDRVAVTWHTVPEYDEFATNTFQIELFFDGRIQISWLDIAAADGLAGLSDGGGLADDFLESDLSAVVSCGPRPPMAADGTASTPINTPLVVALFGVDDGEPYPPGALDYIITGLPTYDLRDVGDGHLITTDDLPYTLVDGGQAVLYAPGLDFVGQDLFEFKANDGGTPPDGGDSNVATVTVQVEPVLALPFFDDFAAVTFDAGQWGRVFHATIDDVGIDPPSPPYAARLNGDPSGGDELWTQRIDLSGETGVLLAYAWQRTGGGNPPEPGDDLIVEYLDEDGAWQLLRQHPGLGDDMTTFELAETFLPPAAFHPVFRLRFRKSQGNAGAFDDWFVDDVLLMSSDAPVAHADEVAVPPNMTTLMTLTASDPNGDPLGFVIEVLPQHGRLDDPVAGPIVAVPHVLADGGAVVEYTPFRNHVGADLLGFSVSDGTHNSGTAAVAISVGGRQRIYAFGLDMDPGWTVAGGWQFGQPQGGGSFAGDPTGGFTDAFVYGYNLAGDYPDNLPATEYLTTTPLDFTGLSTVELRFRRWLGIEAANWDQAHIQVSADDVTWNTVWEHFGAAISESAWSLQVCDLCDVGGAPAVRVRWGLGPTDQSTTYPGWNIDDVEIWALPDGPQLGDMNCDGRLDVFDIDVFIVVLKDVEPYDVYYAAHPACNHRAADCNEDGVVNAFDIDAFVALLLGG
ncbi:MAG: hypothetical protein KKB50_01345 [Planctomycetes bacterium]|nr:hypothetical protein [Planctomycetota bacterium]